MKIIIWKVESKTSAVGWAYTDVSHPVRWQDFLINNMSGMKQLLSSIFTWTFI